MSFQIGQTFINFCMIGNVIASNTEMLFTMLIFLSLQCPLRRMVIQEVGGECKVKEYGLQRIEIQNETVEDNTEIKQSKTLDDNSSTSMISDDTKTHTVMRENNKAAKTNTSVSHPGQIGSHLNSKIAETEMNIAPSDDLPPPKTACQFQADYRHLRKHPAALVKYLQVNLYLCINSNIPMYKLKICRWIICRIFFEYNMGS